jgi:predicted dehydrogenase
MMEEPMSEAKKEMTRRDFVQTGSTAIAAMAAAGIAPSLGVAGANDKIRVAAIGCGGISNHHIKMLGAIKDKENCEIVACFDVFGQRAIDYSNHVKEVFGAPARVHKSLDDLVNDKDVDTIIIATPEHQHFANASACLDAGKKNLYLEKPMCKTVKESAALVKRADAEGAIIQIGVHTTADDVFLAARDYVQSGKLGTILQAVTTTPAVPGEARTKPAIPNRTLSIGMHG